MTPPKTKANSSTNISGWTVTSISFSGIWRMWERLRLAITRLSATSWRNGIEGC